MNPRYNLDEKTVVELKTRFTYHSPKEDQVGRYEEIRKRCFTLAWFLSDACPSSRELSLALTKLEEACMWANAAIARRE